MTDILYIDDNRNNLSLMETVVKSIDPRIGYFGTDSVEDFLSRAGDPGNLYIIDFTLEGMLGDRLYEKLLNVHREARVIITSAGYISDLQDIFLRYERKPLAVTDRFGAIGIVRKEIRGES